jgi:hypothetical protein
MISMSGFVLVDDNEAELKVIHDCFVRAGIPCLPINYINNDPDNITGIDHIDTDVLTPRVVITDLNLSEGTLDAKSLAGPLAELLSNLVKSGPYILYFWSKNASKVEEVVDVLKSRFSDKFNFPLHWGIIDKTEFNAKPSELKNKVQSLLQDSPLFNALFDWENRVASAALKTTNSLFEITAPKLGDTMSHAESLSDTLAVIGNEAVGIKNAMANPSVAIDVGLAPVLNDRLSVMFSDASLWRDAVPKIGKRSNVQSDTKANLNSFYHIENVNSTYSKNCKGVFVKVSAEIVDKPKQKAKFEGKLGRNLDTILTDEFISTRKLEGKSKCEMRQFRTEAKMSSILGFIELSADCDQAQRKTKLHKYVLAALVPIKYEELTYFEHDDIKRDRAHEGIYRTPTFKLNNEMYILLISYRYQIGTVPQSNTNNIEYINKWFGDPIFRLKEQILNDISFQCAQHSMRPGIVAFH